MTSVARCITSAIVVSLVALGSGCGGGVLECGQLPCPEPLLIYGDLTYKGNEPVHLRVRICRNAQCGEGELQAPALGADEEVLQGDLASTASLTSRSASDPWKLTVKVQDANGADGDKVTLKLTTVPGGTVIFDKAASSVTYVVTHPNGSECQPTCRAAVVDFD